MKNLKNWDNDTWLSSKEYISSFYRFLKKEIYIHKNIRILDIGCGRGKIISFISKKYKLNHYPIGIDIINHKIKNNRIKFVKKNAIDFLKYSKLNFDLIILKQSIHFFKNNEIKDLLKMIKKNLNKNGKIIICTLNFSTTNIPTFKLFYLKLRSSLNKDKNKIDLIKKNLKIFKIKNFKFKVVIEKKNYIKMIKKRYISCLLKLTKKEIEVGTEEIKKKFNKKIIFFDCLSCLIYKKK